MIHKHGWRAAVVVGSCGRETGRGWGVAPEGSGVRSGTTTEDAATIRQLQAAVRELRRANQILLRGAADRRGRVSTRPATGAASVDSPRALLSRRGGGRRLRDRRIEQEAHARREPARQRDGREAVPTEEIRIGAAGRERAPPHRGSIARPCAPAPPASTRWPGEGQHPRQLVVRGSGRTWLDSALLLPSTSASATPLAAGDGVGSDRSSTAKPPTPVNSTSAPSGGR